MLASFQVKDLTRGTEPNLFWTSREKNLFWRAKSFWDQDTVRKYWRLLICCISCSHTLSIHRCLTSVFSLCQTAFHAGSINLSVLLFTRSVGIRTYFYGCLTTPVIRSCFQMLVFWQTDFRVIFSSVSVCLSLKVLRKPPTKTVDVVQPS